MTTHVTDATTVQSTESGSSATEKLLMNIWLQLLGIASVQATDNFFALGGHSLAAMRLVKRIDASLGINVPLRAVFENPTLGGLAHYCEKAAGLGNSAEMGVID